MWAWCDIEGRDITANYLPGMDSLMDEYGEGGSKIGTGPGQREVPVSFIFMTGHPNTGLNLGAGSPEQLHMTEKKEHLFIVFENLVKIKSECSCEIFSECGLSDITVKQIGYLRVIDEHGEVTFSRLAKITRNSKPTITEMVNKFLKCMVDQTYRN